MQKQTFEYIVNNAIYLLITARYERNADKGLATATASEACVPNCDFTF